MSNINSTKLSNKKVWLRIIFKRNIRFCFTDSIFEPKDIDLENGDMDDDEKEIEAFKRFCFNSVPLQQKPKISFDMKNISLKKKWTLPLPLFSPRRASKRGYCQQLRRHLKNFFDSWSWSTLEKYRRRRVWNNGRVPFFVPSIQLWVGYVMVNTKCRPTDMLILMSPLFYLSREHWKQFAKESPIRRSNAIFAFTQVVILFVNMNIKMKHYLPWWRINRYILLKSLC